MTARTVDAAGAVRVVTAIDDLDVEVSELEVTTASLDDAFHRLTAA